MSATSSRVLITGATSRVGGELVLRMLRDTNAQLYLLVRKLPNARDPKKRLEIALKLIDSNFNYGDFEDRIHVFSGDLAKRALGIQDTVFEELVKSGIDEVFHLAAFTDRRHFTKDNLLTTNLEGSLRLLRLSKRLRVRTFNHLGLLYASQTQRDPLKDDYLSYIERTNDFNNLNEFVHRLTTASVMKRAQEDGLTYRIFQPASFIEFGSQSSLASRWYYYVFRSVFDVATNYLRMRKNNRVQIAFPAAAVPLYLSTPDYVAQLILAAHLEGTSTLNQIFDVWSQRVNVRDLLQIISKEYPWIQFRWVESRRDLPRLERDIFKRSLIFFEYLMRERVYLPDPRIQELESKYRIPQPVIDEAELRSLARECHRIYSQDPERTRYGKTALALFRLFKRAA